MDILKSATEWAKDEVFSASFFILFSLAFLLGSLGFWRLGRTELARAFIIPTLIAGALLLMVGLGLFFTNRARLASFPTEFSSDESGFVTTEIARAEKTMKEYQNVVFTALPLIIAAAALLLIFVDKPVWRAASITTILLMAVVLLIDSNANARLESYYEQLLLVGQG